MSEKRAEPIHVPPRARGEEKPHYQNVGRVLRLKPPSDPLTVTCPPRLTYGAQDESGNRHERINLHIPPWLMRKMDAMVSGPRSTALLALADLALDMLKAANRKMNLYDADFQAPPEGLSGVGKATSVNLDDLATTLRPPMEREPKRPRGRPSGSTVGKQEQSTPNRNSTQGDEA